MGRKICGGSTLGRGGRRGQRDLVVAERRDLSVAEGVALEPLDLVEQRIDLGFVEGTPAHRPALVRVGLQGRQLFGRAGGGLTGHTRGGGVAALGLLLGEGGGRRAEEDRQEAGGEGARQAHQPRSLMRGIRPVQLFPVDLAEMGLGASELLIILAIVLVVFGASKLPQLGDGLGRAIKNFKRAASGQDELDVSKKSEIEAGKAEDEK